MARFCGKIGFVKSVETAPGVWENQSITKNYRGDILRNTRTWVNGNSINDNVNISNSVSIVANSYLYDNLYAMQFIEWMGARWKIESFEIQRPRIVLSIGGIYNGEQT